MKKKILIALFIIVVILSGCLLYLNIEDNKYATDKYELEQTHDHKEAVEQVPIEIPKEVQLIPELEDLSTPERQVYSLFYFNNLELYPSKQEGSIINNELNFNIKAKEGFHLYKDREDVDNFYIFFNDTGNVSGCILCLDEEYNESIISEYYSNYKETDQQFDIAGYYDSYEFGEIQDFSYKGLQGVYNLTESATYDDGLKVVKPVKYRYVTYLNYNGKILNIYIETYKNCSYGQLSLEELIDKSIEY